MKIRPVQVVAGWAAPLAAPHAGVQLGCRDRRRMAYSGGSWRTENRSLANVSPGSRIISLLVTRRPQQDSNLRSRLRRPLLSPLSYGGYAPPKGYQPKRPPGHAVAPRLKRWSTLSRSRCDSRRRRAPAARTGSKGPFSLGRSWITCPGAPSPAGRRYPHASDAGIGTGARCGRRRGDQATYRGQPPA